MNYYAMKRKWVENVKFWELTIQIYFQWRKTEKISYLRTNAFSNKTEMKMKSPYLKIESKLKYDTKTFFPC